MSCSHSIDKDTALYGSFAQRAGSIGCNFFNSAFLKKDINAIYKSFSVSSIKDAIFASKVLNMSGFAVTMPFKVEVIDYVDTISDEVEKIGSSNTIVNKNGSLVAFNTDWLAAHEMLKNLEKKNLYILGNGGYSKAVQYASKSLGFNYSLIGRDDWVKISSIKNSIIYNCTPVESLPIDSTNIFIDCIATTSTGKKLSQLQASKQFYLYTGVKL